MLKSIKSIVFLLLNNLAFGQSFINGDFEINSSQGTQINLANADFNSFMSNCYGFGTDGNLDIIYSTLFSGSPNSGNWFVALTGGGTDALSLELNLPLITGNNYEIIFYDKKDAISSAFPIEIGLSTTNNSFGETIYTSPTLALDATWTQRVFTFIAPNNGQFVTVRQQEGTTGNWVHIDNFTISCAVNLNLGNDTTLCFGEELVLNIAQPGGSYTWQDFSSDSTFTVTQSGEYIGTVFNACGIRSDTLQVFYETSPIASLGPDVSSCTGLPITLTANGNDDLYLWQDGSSQNTLNVSASGVYWVNITNNCGSVVDSIAVQLGTPTDANLILTECNSISINGIAYNQSGTYFQTLLNSNGCDSILTIEAEILNFNGQIFQTDTTLYYNGNPTSIQWINCNTGQIIPGATQTSFVPQITGNYGAIITIGECVDTSNCRLIPVPPIPKSPTNICENINVSPNPVSDQVSFTLDKESYLINLYSSTGALVWQKKGTPEKQKVDFRNYAPAMYVLQVDQCRFKIVKQ
jgi:hypothetical protein